MIPMDNAPLTRRSFLAALGSLALGSALPRGAVARRKRKPPDVLFISIEDIAPFMGCYGHPVVKTPHIDSLARRSVTFTNAHCPGPICNPSRAALSTGLRPDTTGVFTNDLDWRGMIPSGHTTLYEHFRDNGYETIKCGKLHHGEFLFKKKFPGGQAWENALWNRTLKTAWGGSPRKPVRPKAPTPGWLPTADPKSKMPWKNYLAWSLNWGPTGLADDAQGDGAKARAVATELLAEHDRPRFLAVGLQAPHYPLRAPDKYYAMYDPEEIRLPASPYGDLDDVPKKYGWSNTTDDRWLDEEEKKQVAVAYYASISYVDACVGVMLDAVRKAGREDDTIVCLWGDHGMHMGEHFLYRKGTLFENSTRVPFIISAPGASGNGSACSRPTEIIDIYPTLADLCRLPSP